MSEIDSRENLNCISRDNITSTELLSEYIFRFSFLTLPSLRVSSKEELLAYPVFPLVYYNEELNDLRPHLTRQNQKPKDDYEVQYFYIIQLNLSTYKSLSLL